MRQYRVFDETTSLSQEAFSDVRDQVEYDTRRRIRKGVWTPVSELLYFDLLWYIEESFDDPF